MRGFGGLVLVAGLGLATAAAAGHRDPDGGDVYDQRAGAGATYGAGTYDGRERDLFDGRRYDRRGYEAPRAPEPRAYEPPAYEPRAPEPRYEPRYEPRREDPRARDDRGYDLRDDMRYPPPQAGASPWYRDGRVPNPSCGCGEVRLSSSFFYGDAGSRGGVGPIPGAYGDDGGYGGGYYAMNGGSSFLSSGFRGVSARSFASAHASSRSQVVVHRGGRHGHRHGHHGHGGKKH